MQAAENLAVFNVSPLSIMDGYTFDKWLRDKRNERGLSGPELAAKSGVSKQVISNIERQAPHPITGAAYRPSRATVDKLAEALDEPPGEARTAAGYATGEDEVTAPVDLDISRLLHYFKDLPRECQLDVLASMEGLWRRRRAQGRAERSAAKSSGKHRPQTVKPGVERKTEKRKAS